MIFLQNADGTPLMPSNRPKAIQQKLDAGDARVIRRSPFTVRLTHHTDAVTQPLILGIDPGSTIGLAVIQRDGTPVMLAELATRSHQIPKLIADRAANRRARRKHQREKRQRRAVANGTAFEGTRNYFLQGRNADDERYDPLVCHSIRPKLARMNNRQSKAKGWIAPTVEHFLASHQRLIKQVCALLPITQIVVEYASFDLAKIQHPEIEQLDYQRGEQYGYENVKQYVLDRDGHRCQRCQRGKKTSDTVRQPLEGEEKKRPKKAALKPLHVHHVIWRRNGGSDLPNNLITVCLPCHDILHTRPEENAKFVKLHPGGVKRFQKTTMLNIIMPRFFDWLQNYGIPVEKTYGYMTKLARKTAHLPKEHAIDAYIIACSGSSEAIPHARVCDMPVMHIQQERRHDRRKTTRFEDRKYQVFDAAKGKYVTVAKNRDRKTGQADLGLQEWREQHGEAATSQLTVVAAKKPQKSGFSEMKKGALVKCRGQVYRVRGFSNKGSRLLLDEIQKSFPANRCRRITRNSGMIWHGEHTVVCN